jgi:hypothetical protein
MEDPQLALQSVNEPFEELVRAVTEGLSKEDEPTEPVTEDKALADALTGITQQLAMLDAKVSAIEANPQQVVSNLVPERRSIDPALLQKPQTEQKSETPKLQAQIRERAGLPPIG